MSSDTWIFLATAPNASPPRNNFYIPLPIWAGSTPLGSKSARARFTRPPVFPPYHQDRACESLPQAASRNFRYNGIMFEFAINYGSSATRVTVGLRLAEGAGALLRDALSAPALSFVAVVSDTTVFGHYGSDVMTSLAGAGFDSTQFLIEPGERSKRLEVVEQIHDFLADCGVFRDGVVLALGGGVVSDVAGFAAATWMRGVRFAILPTTLESDVDASIGGKTGVNLKAGKNLVGAFHQPFLVGVDPTCLATLSARDVRAGLAESVKHALIHSEEFLEWHTANLDAILALEPEVLAELIHRNLRIKGAIVEEDVLEQTGRRALLNFGHTIGHAIEACTDYSLRHGECVALGIVAACRLSNDLGMLDTSAVTRVEELLARFGLATELSHQLDTADVMRALHLDKKHRSDGLHLVLLDAIGRPVIRSDISDDAIGRAFESLCA